MLAADVDHRWASLNRILVWNGALYGHFTVSENQCLCKNDTVSYDFTPVQHCVRCIWRDTGGQKSRPEKKPYQREVDFSNYF